MLYNLRHFQYSSQEFFKLKLTIMAVTKDYDYNTEYFSP